MTARYIDDLRDWLAANVASLAAFHPDTNPTGNCRTDTIDLNRMRALQVVLYEGTPGGQIGMNQGNPVRSVAAHIEVFGETIQASSMAELVYDTLNATPTFSQGDTAFMQIALNGGIVPRGQIKAGVMNYGIDLNIKYSQ